jgi:hypothetical protein
MNIEVPPTQTQGSWDVAQSKSTRRHNTRHIAVASSTDVCAPTIGGALYFRQAFDDTSSLFACYISLVREVMGRILVGKQKL